MTDFILHETGLLLHATPAHATDGGAQRPEHVRVFATPTRQIGTYLDFGTHRMAIHWRTAKGDQIQPPTLDALLDRCSGAVDARPRVQAPAGHVLAEQGSEAVQAGAHLVDRPVGRGDRAAAVSAAPVHPPARVAVTDVARRLQLLDREEHPVHGDEG